MVRKNILFLLSHQPNPRFIKQINFLSQNNDVSVIYYFRDYMKDLSSEYGKCVILNESLGSIANGNYIKRLGKYFTSILALKKVLQKNSYDTMIVNNIDALAFFKLSTLFKEDKTTKIIEISDLRSHTYTQSLKSKVIRIVEKSMFRYVDKLIVTSPKFYEMYYKSIFRGNPFILENKPLSNMILARMDKIKNDKVVIGIVGLLLQGKPYKTLFEIIKDSDKYEVHIYGKGIYQKLVEEYENKYENIKYFGEYNFFQDSAKIYASLDILYMPYDTTNGSLNNKIALPNKLYEAMYFQVPIITSKESYLGEIVEDLEIGKALKCCKKEGLLRTLESFRFTRYLNNLKNLEKEKYFADNDYRKLDIYIKEAR